MLIQGATSRLASIIDQDSSIQVFDFLRATKTLASPSDLPEDFDLQVGFDQVITVTYLLFVITLVQFTD